MFLFAENAFISWLGICNRLIENKILNLLNEQMFSPDWNDCLIFTVHEEVFITDSC